MRPGVASGVEKGAGRDGFPEEKVVRSRTPHQPHVSRQQSRPRRFGQCDTVHEHGAGFQATERLQQGDLVGRCPIDAFCRMDDKGHRIRRGTKGVGHASAQLATRADRPTLERE
jgi:hypothetical protein